MIYSEFVNILTHPRMYRYHAACGGDSMKTMTLYRLNLKLAGEFLSVVSFLEISFRNTVNNHCLSALGNDWLRDGANAGGIFDNLNCRETANAINEAILFLNGGYTHNKLVAELGFGFWRYMFAKNQYAATGKILLSIFPAHPATTLTFNFNQDFVFNQLKNINNLRNRIAHHEPICFIPRSTVKSATYARQHYHLILQLLQWMSIDDRALLYGVDHIINVCNQIDAL
ncbi:MAG: Abi family protein [Bacteroidota bacterium]